MRATESKTITGKIIAVSQSAPRSTCWGEFLFRGREVTVQVKGNSPPNNIIMYVRDDSWISLLKIPIESLVHKSFFMNVHGEAYQDSKGIIIIDRINPCTRVVKSIELTHYFDID